MLKTILIIFILSLVSFSSLACRVRIVSSGITFNYVTNQVYTVEPQIRIRRANQCRTLMFEVIPNGESEFVFKRQGRRLPISVNFDRNDNFVNRASVISTRINPVANGRFTYPFYFKLIDSEIPRSLVYNSRFTMRVFELENPTVNLAERNNRHRLDVPPIFGINFDSAENTVDFGNIRQGAERSIQVRLDGNIGYQVSMRSREGNVLKNTFNPATIRYRFSWDGVEFPLSNAYSVVGSYPEGQQVGIARMTIDEDTTGKTDGEYQDIIEVLLQSQ